MRRATLAAVGLGAAAAALASDPVGARQAAAQAWPPFALVAGLLLIGVVADEEGLFRTAGDLLARVARSPLVLFLGASVLVVVTTALLNLDTSVAFLTPILVVAARRRGGSSALLYGCILLSNAGSLFLPGSNLTNLLVLGHARPDGGTFLRETWLPGLCAVIVTVLVVGILERRSLGEPRGDADVPARRRLGVGSLAVVVAAVLVVTVRAPALPVLCVGVGAVALRLAGHRLAPRVAIAALGAETLALLFGVAIAAGTLGRAWSGPSTVLSHLGDVATALVAALAAVLVNNLPASALLAAHRPPRPFSLLIGLDLGPNLLATGSLAWILWYRGARAAGSRPSLRRAALLGAVATPVSVLAAAGVLAARGGR